MRRICALLAFLGLFTAGHVGTLNAAQIDIAPGIDPDQRAILIRGPIEPGDDNRFFDLAEQAPRATVLLESPGGNVTTGLSIGAEISIRGYATLVLDGSGCHSICAVIWVAGQRRYMSPDAKISVHAAYRMRNDANGSVESSESGVANAQIGAFLNEVGLSHDAIRYFTFAGPSDDLLQITPYVAQALSIDVALQSPNGITPISERPTPRRITRQTSEYAGMIGNCTELFKVNGAFWREQSGEVMRRGHEIFSGEIFAPLLGEYVAATKADLRNKGTPYWCLSAERNLRNDGLATGISGPSFDCAKASTRTERAICASPDLWAADRVMASLYFYYRDSDDAYRSKDFLASQRSWLARRDQCSDDAGCLTEQYTRRLIDFGF